jgi:RNA polymerase sigma factor (sigma-70 family)
MLRNFPTVRRWADTDDVLQNTLIRLQRVLQQWKPSTSEDFFQMAAAQMRRALLDLARFFSKREQAGLRAAGDTPFDVADIGDSSSELERWCTFHEAVERLPDDQRAIVTLRFYHGWPVGQIAESLRISERTIIRRWQAALWKLGNIVLTPNDGPSIPWGIRAEEALQEWHGGSIRPPAVRLRCDCVACRAKSVTGQSPTPGDLPMLRQLFLVTGLVVTITVTAGADEQRLLQGDDAQIAAQLQKKINDLAAADDYEGAIRSAEELLALRNREQGVDHWQTVDAKWLLDGQRKIAALPDEERADWRKTVLAINEAGQLDAKGQYAKAQPLWQEYRRQCEQVFGEKHPATGLSYNRLAINLKAQGRYADAQSLVQKALDLDRHLLGEKHPTTAGTCNNLGTNLSEQGKHAEAYPLLLKALDIDRELLGEESPEIANVYNNLGLNLVEQGKYAEAYPLLQKALDLRRKLFGEKNHLTAISYNNLACNLDNQGKYAEAQPLLQRALDLKRELFGEKHPSTARSYHNLAFNLNAQKKYADAQRLGRKALELFRDSLGERHPHTATGYGDLALNLEAQGRFAEAQPLVRKALELRLSLLGEMHQVLLTATAIWDPTCSPRETMPRPSRYTKSGSTLNANCSASSTPVLLSATSTWRET